MLTDVTTLVMVATDSTVLVILAVTPDGRVMSVKMVGPIRNMYIYRVYL